MERYSRTKKIGEEMVLKANGQNGLLTASLRPCKLYGEGDVELTKHMVEAAERGSAKYWFVLFPYKKVVLLQSLGAVPTYRDARILILSY